jgi:hypothetical protein
MADVIIPILDSTDETIHKARYILSTTHNRNIDIIIHSVNDSTETMYPFIEELIEYRIIYASKKIRAYVPVNALNLACLLCLVADEYYANPGAIFSPFALILKTPSLALTEADVDNYLKMPISGPLAAKLTSYRAVFKHFHPRFELIIKLHPKYGACSDKILERLLYKPSQHLSDMNEMLQGICNYLSVEDMIAIGAAPVGVLPFHICRVISSLLPKD